MSAARLAGRVDLRQPQGVNIVSAATDPAIRGAKRRPATISRIAAGVDGYAEGNDAAVLAASIARVTQAELMLVAVHPDPLVVMPEEMNWKSLEKQAAALLAKVRDSLAPDARSVVETDLSVPRALERRGGRSQARDQGRSRDTQSSSPPPGWRRGS